MTRMIATLAFTASTGCTRKRTCLNARRSTVFQTTAYSSETVVFWEGWRYKTHDSYYSLVGGFATNRGRNVWPLEHTRWYGLEHESYVEKLIHDCGIVDSLQSWAKHLTMMVWLCRVSHGISAVFISQPLIYQISSCLVSVISLVTVLTCFK